MPDLPIRGRYILLGVLVLGLVLGYIKDNNPETPEVTEGSILDICTAAELYSPIDTNLIRDCEFRSPCQFRSFDAYRADVRKLKLFSEHAERFEQQEQ